MKDQPTKDSENGQRDAAGQYKERKAGDLDDTVDSGIREGAPSLNQEGGGLDLNERVTRVETWLKFLATREDLARLEAKLEAKIENCATREDLLATREDLLATRDELKAETSSLREDLLATRDELKAETSSLREEMAKLEIRLRTHIDDRLSAFDEKLSTFEAKLSTQMKWMIRTMIALAGVIIASVVAAVRFLT